MQHGLNVCLKFLSRLSMLERDIGTGGMCVSPSHAGIDSKLRTVGSCVLHRWVAQKLLFFWDKLSCRSSRGLQPWKFPSEKNTTRVIRGRWVLGG